MYIPFFNPHKKKRKANHFNILLYNKKEKPLRVCALPMALCPGVSHSVGPESTSPGVSHSVCPESINSENLPASSPGK